MKTLYLLRHAKSSWEFPRLADIDRPLNKRGQRDAPEMGRRLRKRQILPDLIFSSPANRALTAAQMIAKEIAYEDSNIVTSELVYHAGVQSLMEIIHSFDDNLSSVMLVGHNPGFTSLANALSDFSTDNVPTTGVVAFQFDVEHWAEVKRGEFLFFDYPKKV